MSRADDADRLARLALSHLTEPGNLRIAALVTELGAVRVRAELIEQRRLSGEHEDIAVRLESCHPEEMLAAGESAGLRYLVPGDEEWPHGLDDLADAGAVQEMGGVPLGLWVRGALRLDSVSGAVAVVGARASTSYGDDFSMRLGADLASAGRIVVSGAAAGIDQAAHRGALAAQGRTIAALACGADRAYPSSAGRMLDLIAEEGAVLSEVPPRGAPLRHRFLARNRLIAALAAGTVVVEAGYRSGALNTAHWTERLNRPLMGVPGPVTSASSQGVHQHLRSGRATLVTQAEDVLELVSKAGEHLVAHRSGATRTRDRLTTRHRRVLEAVPVSRRAHSDSIARTAGIGLAEVRSALAHLQRCGYVDEDVDGWRLGDGIRDEIRDRAW